MPKPKRSMKTATKRMTRGDFFIRGPLYSAPRREVVRMGGMAAPTLTPSPELATALARAVEAARVAGVYVIARGQAKRDASIVIVNGATEHMAVGRMAGLGVQVFTPDGC